MRFIKSSIKRPYSQVNDDIRTAIESMREGDNGEVEYVVNVGGKEEHFLPSHLAGTYISDRIEDIKNDRKAERMNLVISVALYSLAHTLDSGIPHRGAGDGTPGRTEDHGHQRLPLHHGARGHRCGVRLLQEPEQGVRHAAADGALRGCGLRRGSGVRGYLHAGLCGRRM